MNIAPTGNIKYIYIIYVIYITDNVYYPGKDQLTDYTVVSAFKPGTQDSSHIL